MYELNKFNKIFIDKFKGKNKVFISLCMGYEGSDGKKYPHKIKQKFGRDSDWKDSFFKISFDNEEQLKDFAKWLYIETRKTDAIQSEEQEQHPGRFMTFGRHAEEQKKP